MELSRARGSEEVVEVKEEKTTMVADWDSPNLAEELVDRIWDMVKDWLRDREPAASDFFHYCLNFCDNRGEADEVRVWMLNLIAHFVTEDEKWLDSVHTAKDWRQLGLSCNHWEVPPPLWLVEREVEDLKKEDEKKKKESEKMEESLECSTTSPVLILSESAEESLENTTTSPLDRDWGKELPAPSTAVAAPSTPVWRPWEEEEEEEEVVNLSASVQKRKRRSPAAAARSRRRLQQWQEKKDKARLVSELRTTPWRPVKQIRSANLLERLDKYHFDVEGLTNVETLEEKKAKSTVFFSNHSQTSMLPQLTSPSLTPKTLHQTSSLTEVISPVNVVKRCPSCCAWIMPITTD